MKRLILTAPEMLSLEDMTEAQLQALESVMAQWVSPMPGTIPAQELKVIDALTSDDFTPELLAATGLPLTIIGMWQWDGQTVTELHPLDPGFRGYLRDANAQILPHGWAGWPAVNSPE